MFHSLIMLTFDQPLSRAGTSGASSYRPRLPGDGFERAELSRVVIEDDDPNLQYFRQGVSGYEDEDRQTLVAATTFGNETTPFPPGTHISAHHATIITDENGNEFFLFFTTVSSGQPNDPPQIVGGYHSAFIIPKMKVDDDGNETWPEFDPSLSFSGNTAYIMGSGATANKNIPLDPNGIVDDPNAGDPPCFTPGTLIETADGDKPVELLQPGDLVRTRDHGLQPVRWIGSTHLDAHRLDLQPNLRPITIGAGAIGCGMPAQALTVSPQHRILIRSRIAQRMFDQPEVLVAAKHLLGMDSIHTGNPPAGITYIHIMFDRHEVIRSNGAWTESFYVGPQALKGVERRIMREITALFPQLAQGQRPRAARRLLSGREGRRLAERHARNGKVLVS